MFRYQMFHLLQGKIDYVLFYFFRKFQLIVEMFDNSLETNLLVTFVNPALYCKLNIFF